LSRRPSYDSLVRLIDPTGNFSILRGLLRSHDGLCIPFVVPYLTDLAHINDTYTDENNQICFVKRQKWYDTVHIMLRFQSRQCDIARVDSTMEYVERHLRDIDEVGRDQNWFWSRSRELQQNELAQHDLLRGLEAAGF